MNSIPFTKYNNNPVVRKSPLQYGLVKGKSQEQMSIMNS
jgi:hypothetical protein